VTVVGEQGRDEQGHRHDDRCDQRGRASPGTFANHLDEEGDEEHHQEAETADADPRGDRGQRALGLAHAQTGPREASVRPGADEHLAPDPQRSHDGRKKQEARPGAREGCGDPSIGERDQDQRHRREDAFEDAQCGPGQRAEVARGERHEQSEEDHPVDQPHRERASDPTADERDEQQRGCRERQCPHRGIRVGEIHQERSQGRNGKGERKRQKRALSRWGIRHRSRSHIEE